MKYMELLNVHTLQESQWTRKEPLYLNIICALDALGKAMAARIVESDTPVTPMVSVIPPVCTRETQDLLPQEIMLIVRSI